MTSSRTETSAAAHDPSGRGSAVGLPGLAGLGLKPQHVADLVVTRPALGFVEVHAENYMVAGGPLHHGLTQVRAAYPLSLHGVGLSLGGVEPPDEAHLNRLAALIDRYEPAAFSEHLAWSTHAGRYFNDLLPLAYDGMALQRVCQHIDRVQERLGLRMLLENPSTYVEFEQSTFGEADFLGEVVRRTGCGLLLDVTNAYVSCTNHGRDVLPYLDALPLHAVGQIHLAGFAHDHDALGAPLLIDHHGSAVADTVWALYAGLIQRLGPVPTLLERDNDVPSLATLLVEVERAALLLTRFGGERPARSAT